MIERVRIARKLYEPTALDKEAVLTVLAAKSYRSIRELAIQMGLDRNDLADTLTVMTGEGTIQQYPSLIKKV